MSEFTRPPVDQNEYSQPPLEEQVITPEDIANAPAEVIVRAATARRKELTELAVGVTSPARRKTIRQELANAGAAEIHARGWARDGVRRERRDEPSRPFDEYLNERLDDLFAGGRLETSEEQNAAERLTEAGRWSLGVGEYSIRRVLEAQRSGNTTTTPTNHPERPTQQQPAPNKAEATQTARRTVEQAHNMELFAKVVAQAKGKTDINVDTSTVERTGYQHVGDAPKSAPGQRPAALFPEMFMNKELRTSSSTGWRKERNEVVSFTELEELKTQTVEREVEQVKSGAFGRKKTVTTKQTETEVVPGSEHPVMVENIHTGKKEPAVRFRYQFRYGHAAHSATYAPRDGGDAELPRYREFHGPRGGQNVLVGVDLPQSVAAQLQEQIAKDPKAARELVEQLVLQNNDGNGGITEKYWRGSPEGGHNPIRPPYDELPADWPITTITGRELYGRHGRSQVVDYTIR
jgi:hypothetical protein